MLNYNILLAEELVDNRRTALSKTMDDVHGDISVKNALCNYYIALDKLTVVVKKEFKDA